ncbi:MAG: sugar nucleotide-binding protein [Bacteroidia bacterium]|nr:sugar nucleotide-binding protein [Bacteroidia bacterium]
MKQILLTGGTGMLGKAIIKSGKFKNLLAPSSSELDICNPDKIKRFLDQNKVHYIIHAAAMARLVGSENTPLVAIHKNIIGTSNLVSAVINEESMTGSSIRFLHISTDGVYAGTEGKYHENSSTIPKTKYGWSKLGAECAVRFLANHCIIRTRFFDTENIPFETSAVDIYTSKIPLNLLVQYICQILQDAYIGTLNVGGERISDFACYSKYKSSIKECSREDIAREVPFEVPSDISMDISNFNNSFKITS